MNLIGEGWIPVTFGDSSTGMVGLQELYERGDEICDLVVTPPERIALMRLFLCITQTALNGPEDEEDCKTVLSVLHPRVLLICRNTRTVLICIGISHFCR